MKRRTSSASQKVPPHLAHRRVSNERHLNKQHHGPHQGAQKRNASAAQMAGKFQGEKARAAEAIAARLQAQHAAEKEKQAEARDKLLASQRQKSMPVIAMAQRRKTQGVPIVADDEDEWSSETEETVTSGVAAATGEDGHTASETGPKRLRGKEMDLVKAADEARRQRELFAKRAVFGEASKCGEREESSGPANAPRKPGLLSNLFETQRDVIRRNASMVDLVSFP